jgi:drug/metabolite transporter (DMT)-like permease
VSPGTATLKGINPQALGLSLLASVLWAAYYPLIVVLPSSADGVVLVLPFLFGALPFLALRSRTGPGDPSGERTPLYAYVVAGIFMMALQLDVIVSTRLVGAVPTAIFTLLGDVVAIPIISFLFWREGSQRVLAPKFWVGAIVATVGATLAIAAGESALPLGWKLAALEIPIPILVGLYFAFVARLTQKVPIQRVVGPVTLCGFLASLVALPFLGGLPSFGVLPPLGYVDLLVVGLTTFFVAPWAFFEASRRVSVVIPAVVNATIPIFTMVFMVGFLGAPIYLLALLGIPLAFGGALLAITD